VELEPALRGATFAGAFLSDDADLVDTHAYVGGLLGDAARRGAKILLGVGARQITETAEGVEVLTVQGRLLCDRLVVAAGAWSGQLPGLPEVPVRPQRGQMLTVFHPTVRLSRIVSGPTYLAPWRSGEVVVGATEEDVGFLCHPTPAGMLHLTAALARLSPPLRDARFVTAWAGLRSTAPNGHPMIGAYPGTKRVLLASGHGGQGILTGGLTGREVAVILDQGRSEAVAAFEPSRALSAPATAHG
jgi:glycine oxidase